MDLDSLLRRANAILNTLNGLLPQSHKDGVQSIRKHSQCHMERMCSGSQRSLYLVDNSPNLVNFAIYGYTGWREIERLGDRSGEVFLLMWTESGRNNLLNYNLTQHAQG